VHELKTWLNELIIEKERELGAARGGAARRPGLRSAPPARGFAMTVIWQNGQIRKGIYLCNRPQRSIGVKNGVFWDVSPCGSCITDVSEVRRLLVTASVVRSSPILVTLIKEVLSSSERSVLIRTTWRNIPEDAILHSHRSENLNSYIVCRCVS
jgi:hypothetical protein